MSSEAPPNPITNVFNVKDWIPTTSSGNSDFATNATNAVTSSNVVVTAPSLNQDHFPTFVSASTGASLPEIADPDLKYNPSTNLLSVPNLTVSGTLNATVATATTATNADKIKVTTGSGATPLSLALVDGITGNVNTLASSALTYTPSTDTLSVGTLTTASNCTIGNSLSTFAVNSGTSNIGNGGLGATDKINIASGTNTTGSELILGSTTLTRAFIRAVDVNINHQRAGNINIGADTLISTTNILGTTNIGSTSKVLTINAPMVINYPTTALTLPTQIGYTVRDTITLTGTIPSNTNRYFFGAGGKVLPAGVWLIQFTTRGRSTGTSTFTRYFTWGEDSVTGTNPLNAMTSLSSTTVIDSEGLSTCGAFTVTSTGTTTYNIAIFFIYTGSAILFDAGEFGSTVKRTRLA